MKINLKESLNELDIISDNRYDLYNTYLAKNPSNDLKKKIAEAIYDNRSPKEILMILNEDWDDEEESKWEVMDHKSVRDSDGFITDYTWYKNSNTGEHVFVFGDSDLYGPEDGWFDWECDSDEEAEEWFDNYKGPGDEDDWMDESLEKNYKWKITYGKGKPDNKEEVVEFPTYKEAKKYAADHAKGWGFEVKKLEESLGEALYDDIYHDFRVARENWKKLNLDIDFDSALDEWNKKSKLADSKNHSKPIYNKKAWDDMVSMFSNKNESLKEDYSDYDKALAQVDREAEELIRRYDKGDESIFDILSDLGYVSDDPNSVYMYKEVGNGNAIVFDLEPFDDGKGYIKYFVVDDSDKIPSGYTSTRLFIDESLKKTSKNLDEDMIRVEPTEKDLNKLVNVITKYGFKLDNKFKPGRGLFGSYHVQVINPDLDYIDDDQLVKDVESLGNALDNLSFDINLPITYNFGANDDNVITGGIDIHVGYKDDSDLTESITYPNGKEASNIDIHKALNYMYGEDRDMNDDSYTNEEKQKAVNYWIKKTDGIHEDLNESFGDGVRELLNLDPEDLTDSDKVEYMNWLDDDKKDVFYALRKFDQELLVAEHKLNGWFWTVFDADEKMIDKIHDLKSRVGTLDESLNEASYGGAFDIEDDMYFTSEDIVEFGDTIAIDFSKEVGRQFDLSDAYMTTPTQLHLEFTDNDFDYVAYIKIDMRKIRVPSDIYKYKNEVMRQLKDQISNEDSY